jgi:hypothetical protein
MALRLPCVLGVVALSWTVAPQASAQGKLQQPSVEADLTGGYSGEEVRAAGVQLRAFGEVDPRSRIQYFAEAAWGQRWSEEEMVDGGLIGTDPIGSDVFGAAYPYKNSIQLIEAYAERTFQRRRMMMAIKGGQFRTPFGIYDRSDFGYCGFIRPPLIRYDGYFGLSNNYTERGIQATVGVPAVFVQASLARPHDLGSSQRRAGMDESVRVQAYRGPFIVGVSHARSEPYLPSYFAFGRQTFTGVDVRWTHSSGVQLRGEFFHGHSYHDVTTNGWYIDGLVHHVGMGPFTAVTRVERMDYSAPSPFARSADRFTVGTRIRLPYDIATQVNYMTQGGDLPKLYNRSVDVTMTYSFRYR